MIVTTSIAGNCMCLPASMRNARMSSSASRCFRAEYGRGHLEYGHGTPYQLADLGIRDVAVLLPNDTETVHLEEEPIADGLFGLPQIERSVAERR